MEAVKQEQEAPVRRLVITEEALNALVDVVISLPYSRVEKVIELVKRSVAEFKETTPSNGVALATEALKQ